MTYSQLWRRLLPLYDEREAKAVVRTLLEERFNLTLTDLYTDGLDRLTDEEKVRMETRDRAVGSRRTGAVCRGKSPLLWP